MRTATTAAILFLASTPLFAQADDEQVQRRHKATAPASGEVRTVSVGEGEPRRTACDVDLPGQFCFRDEDGNGTFDKARVVSGSRIPSVSARYSEYWKPVKPEEGRKSGYRWELVYLGAGGGVLRFSAREYVDDPDRPATQNEVAYDLKTGEPTSLTFRGVRLEVLEAGNDGIKLRVAPGE